MHGWLTTKKDDIGLLGRIAEQPYPSFHSLPAQHRAAMLAGVDIAVRTGEVAGREHMQENISFAGFETDGLGITHGLRVARQLYYSSGV